MKLFKQKSKEVIGIDVGTYSIKLVELAGSHVNPKVVAWGVENLPAGAFAENTIADKDAVASALNGLITKSGVKGDRISVGLSSSHAITKVLSMPKNSNEYELEEQVSIEALHFIPYPIDEVNLDFEVLGPSQDSSDEIDVLLVACRRQVVDDYIDLIESVDLELSYVDIDTYALERVYRAQNTLGSGSDQPVAMFDVGYADSHFVVVDQHRVLYSRHQNFGAQQLVNQIRKEYGVGISEAEEIMKSVKPPSDFLSAVQKPFVEMMRQELERGLQFFYSSSAYSNIDRILLAGGCCALDGVVSDMEKKMQTSVSLINPVANARVMRNKAGIVGAAPSLSVAYGLSLRGLS